MSGRDGSEVAVRLRLRGDVQGGGLREATLARAAKLGVLGWVRNEEDGSVAVHAEGAEEAIDALTAFLEEGPGDAVVEELTTEPMKRSEGHEQFAIRGVSAGRFTVREATGSGGGFVLGLELEGGERDWKLSKEPSMRPADKRFAIEVQGVQGGESTWDEGIYEQGGRVPWPEAIDRGHAVFVLHGERLRGGFALQRTAAGPPSRWLLIKRRDEYAEN